MIIIIEDEPFLQDLMVAEVHLQGLACQCFNHLKDAADALARGPVELVLADIGATEGGIGLMALLIAMPQLIPAILISGRPDWNFRRLFAMGAAGYFAKPFSRDAFVKRMTHLLTASDHQWASPPSVVPPAQAFSISQVAGNIGWGRRGFCLDHTDCYTPKLDGLARLQIGEPHIDLLAQQVWHSPEESGWLIWDVLAGRDALLDFVQQSDPHVAVPFSIQAPV